MSKYRTVFERDPPKGLPVACRCLFSDDVNAKK